MAKRVGRPEVAASQRREIIFRFVATKAEAVKIRGKAKALGLTISEYLRGVAIPKE
jgi:mobilization protein NikA